MAIATEARQRGACMAVPVKDTAIRRHAFDPPATAALRAYIHEWDELAVLFFSPMSQRPCFLL
jgi:hypothetical protein